jgi:acetylornithine/N-succinyldiaminopimelate aminotransferase
VKEIGEYLWDKIEELASKYPVITEHRGAGLIQGIEFSIPVAPIVEKAIFEEKLVIISAGTNVIRLVPPLIIEKKHVDDMVVKLESLLKDL